MHSPFTIIAGIVTRKPFVIAGLIVCTLLVALYGTTLLSMQTGYETYVDMDTPRGILLDNYLDSYSADSLILLIEADDVMSPDVLAYIGRIEAELQNEQYVTGTSSLADLLVEANGGVLPSSRAEIDGSLQSLPAGTAARYLPSSMMTVGVVALEAGMSEDAQYRVIDSISARLEQSDMPPGVSVKVTGGAAFNKQMGTEMGTSMGTLIMAAMALMVVAVGILFGHVRYRLLSVAIVAAGLIFTFGFMGLAGMKINMVTIAAFPVLIGIGIDYAIQFHSRFDEEMQAATPADAARATITKAGPAVIYAMLATSMGFIAMWVSPLPMIRSFGEVCVIGVVSCYLAALLIVPTFCLIMKYRPRHARGGPGGAAPGKGAVTRYNEGIGFVVERVAKHPVPVLLVCGLVAFAGIQFDSRIAINTNEDSFVPPDMPAKVDLDKVTRTMGPADGLPVVVQGDNVLGLDTVRWMHEFQEYELSHNSKVSGSVSIADQILAYNGGQMPRTEAGLDDVLSRIPAETKQRYTNGNGEAVIEFFVVEMENDVAMSFIDQMKKEIAWMQPPPGVTATITGEGEMFTNLITEIRESKAFMTVLGFGLIFGFLLLVFRKVGRAATPLVPIGLIVGWNGLVMFVLGIDYTPMTATLGSMTIGVASEYTILIMERCYEELENGLPLVEAIRQSVQKIGTAITVSGLTTIFGFSALMLSSFGIISNFGILTVISVGFALLGAIIIMPAVLVIAGSFRAPGRRVSSPAPEA
jgi:hydrophobe/amphiphile efflux-3 (HAE3) family protein